MSEIKRFCKYCNEEHVVSPTYDNERNLVGYFCNREKLLIESDTPLWNGLPITTELMRFVDERVDMTVLERMDFDRIPFLAKRIAFQLLQTDWAKGLRLNFAFAQYWLNNVIHTVWVDLNAKVGR